MKVRVTIELDIPESLYRDDVEDAGMDEKDLPKHHLGFVKDSIFTNFISYAQCKHIESALEWMTSNSETKQFHIDDHKLWHSIISEGEKTLKIEPVFDIEKFRKQFDELMGSFTDEELVEEFRKLGCNVEIKKDE